MAINYVREGKEPGKSVPAMELAKGKKTERKLIVG